MAFLAPEMLPYSVSFLIFLIFAFLEIVSFFFGWGIFSFLDELFDSEPMDIEVGETTTLGSFFSYINPQKVPLSMVLISLFFTFGLFGHLLQSMVGMLPLYMTLPVIVTLTVVMLRHITNVIGNILPRETSEVVSTDSFIGKSAIILDPTAKRNRPARAKLRDVYGENHYIRIEPLSDEDMFNEGDKVIILEQQGSIFLVERSLI